MSKMFGTSADALVVMSPTWRGVIRFIATGAFVLGLWLCEAPFWAALAMGNIVYTLDEILCVLTVRANAP